jgi:hypothetical protein
MPTETSELSMAKSHAWKRLSREQFRFCARFHAYLDKRLFLMQNKHDSNSPGDGAMKRHRLQLWITLLAFSMGGIFCVAETDFLAHYKGMPFADDHFHDTPQKIPGKIYCAYYDRGGEGVAYHDTDAKNNGSGALNPADGSYLNEFRMHEGVDISYTKFSRTPDKIDDTQYDKVQPPPNILYVGWTVPGEWFNITVQVEKAGWYSADLLYTSNRGGRIALDVNGERATEPLTIESTADPADPIAWRQWHHWNLARGIAKVKLSRGRNVLTVHILTEGQMNLAYFDFKKAD